MLKPLKTYNIAGNTVILQGYDLGGYGEDGGLEYEFAEDIGEMTVGALGDSVFSFNYNDLMYVNITVLETTKTYRDLFTLMSVQMEALRNGLPITPLSYYHADASNGDVVKSAFAVFVQRPAPSKSRTVSERVFRLALPNAGESLVLGQNNLI